MSQHPHVLFILSDQQRWDTLGCYGQRLNITPHLDQMASEGVRFENAFTCQPVCGPARACLQTGQYATQTGNVRNGIPLDQDLPTVAKQMREAGYHTAYVGKWHLASRRGNEQEDYTFRSVPPAKRGGYVDYWMAADMLEFSSHGYEGTYWDTDGNRVDWEGYRVDRTTDYALNYLREYATRQPVAQEKRKPFFLFLSYIEPHHQNDLDRYVGPIGSKQRFARYDVPGDLRGTNGDWREHYPDYLGCCWSLDQNVARIREALTLHGLDENTLIIYTSDHGSHFRTRNAEYKRSCHESSLRIPMIVHGPGFTGGKVINEMVSLIDLPATVLQAGGAETLPRQAGRPLQKLVNGKTGDWPDDVFIQLSEASTGRAVRTHRYKYAVDAPDVSASVGSADRYVEAYLYDLDADPHERNNLMTDPDYVKVRHEMRQRLKRRMVEAGESEPEIEGHLYKSGFAASSLPGQW